LSFVFNLSEIRWVCWLFGLRAEESETASGSGSGQSTRYSGAKRSCQLAALIY